MEKLIFIWMVLLLAKVCDGASHRQLRDKLMKKYGDVAIRPVENVSSTVKVSVRPLFQNLIEMDIKNQQFTIDSWMKLVWTDEFLTWDPAEFNGADNIYFPASSVWLPDITFYENVDLLFQRFKEDTVIQVDSSGKITWFVPTIFVSACQIRVTWYPFDTQVCDMTFGSFGYTGKELQFYPDNGADSVQTRFLENGVWDMVAVQNKQIVTKFACCENPFYDVQYRLIFKRRPAFYMKFLIFPVFLLSMLSTLVFYLPAESGEKISLSITSLLALVVYQQVISENMPPSGVESPVIGSFFISMIAMVSASVVATIIVLHMSRISYRPAPSWVRWLVLEKLPRFFCIKGVRKSHRKITKSLYKPSDKSFEKCITQTLATCSIGVPIFSESISNNSNASLTSRNFGELMQEENQNQHEWKLVSLVVDRCLMVIFSTVTIVITVTLLAIIFIGSRAEFEKEMDILNNSWKMSTNRSL